MGTAILLLFKEMGFQKEYSKAVPLPRIVDIKIYRRRSWPEKAWLFSDMTGPNRTGKRTTSFRTLRLS